MRRPEESNTSAWRLREALLDGCKPLIERGQGRADLQRVEPGSRLFGALGTHVGRLALPGDDHAVVLEEPERALDRPDRHTALLRDLCMARQPITGPQCSVGDLTTDRLSDLRELRTRIVRIESLHVKHGTAGDLGPLAIAMLPRLSKVATLLSIAQTTA